MEPVIGIVICGVDTGRQFVTDTYIEAVQKSGGTAVLIPRSASGDFQRYADICDGFLFCGGDDISPLLFGEDLMTGKGRTDWRTDSFHLLFMKYVLSSHLPILGICRGMQVMNLALGGSIYQDLSLRPEQSANHMQASSDRGDPSHKITLSPNSILYNIFGNSYRVNSFHHQCIKTLGLELRITAIASDGVIEALESSTHPFAVGVQWHPECMYHADEKMRELFRLFIEKSSSSKTLSLL